MYGSITRITTKPGQVDAAVEAHRAAWTGQAAPQGVRHTYLLVDRDRDELVIVGLWEDEATANALDTRPEVEQVRRALRPLIAAGAPPERRTYEVVETQ